ncbi:MAG: hypothetical protein JW928_05090, partial [Candidatus Aureabacteria bacterium]|nr:hypothetical protein [Candidatus Auribacterota bacterium]
GAFLGALNGGVLLAGLIVFFSLFPSSFCLRMIYKKSFFGYPVARTIVFMHNKIFAVAPAMSYFDGERFLEEIDSRVEALEEQDHDSGKER